MCHTADPVAVGHRLAVQGKAEATAAMAAYMAAVAAVAVVEPFWPATAAMAGPVSR